MLSARQMWIDRCAGSGSRQGSATILIDFDFAQLREIIDDVLPLQILVAPFRKAVEELLSENHGKKTTKNVTVDSRICFVEDWAGPKQRLGDLEAVLYSHQISIPKHDLQRRHFSVGTQDKNAIKARLLSNTLAIDGEVIFIRCRQEAPVTFVRHQRLIPLRQLALRTGEEFGPGLGILAGLLPRCGIPRTAAHSG